jgi:hypothetical protein
MSPPWTNLASLAIGGPLYGLYLVLYLTSTSVLVHRSNASHTGPLYRSTVFISGLILFVAVTGVGGFPSGNCSRNLEVMPYS